MNTGVRQSDHLAVVQTLAFRFGFQAASLQHQHSKASADKLPCQGDSSRSAAHDANIGRNHSSVVEFGEIPDHQLNRRNER